MPPILLDRESRLVQTTAIEVLQLGAKGFVAFALKSVVGSNVSPKSITALNWDLSSRTEAAP